MEFTSGFAAAQEAIASTPSSGDYGNATHRFWLDRNNSAKVVFISDQPDAVLREHQVPRGGNMKGYHNVACLDQDGQGAVDCPFCKANNFNSVVGLFTILRMTEISLKSGSVLKNPVQVLAAKKPTLAILQKQHEKRGGLRGCIYEVSRTDGKTTPNVGDVWDYEERIAKEDILRMNPEAAPIDFNDPENGEILRWDYDQMLAHAKAVNLGDSRSSAPASTPHRAGSAPVTETASDGNSINW